MSLCGVTGRSRKLLTSLSNLISFPGLSRHVHSHTSFHVVRRREHRLEGPGACASERVRYHVDSPLPPQKLAGLRLTIAVLSIENLHIPRTSSDQKQSDRKERDRSIFYVCQFGNFLGHIFQAFRAICQIWFFFFLWSLLPKHFGTIFPIQMCTRLVPKWSRFCIVIWGTQGQN